MPFDQKLYERISNIGAETDDETVATYSAYLLARLRLLGASSEAMGRARPRPTMPAERSTASLNGPAPWS